ncbi:DUF2567 domain-containing protein [Micromonospora sp. NPDC048830]|uniref:DUF2567 domain-containing protein n=1 Tax=Micromonospora sp. NPDC048830 TaxID=3364257 RepID=UPI0037111780
MVPVPVPEAESPGQPGLVPVPAPGASAGLPVPAGTPAPAPGADPFAWPAPGAPPAPGSLPPAVAGPPRRPGRAAAVALGAAAVLTGLGVPLGLLWAAVAPGTPLVKAAEGAVYAQPQPEQPIAADGWFSILGLGFGVLAAVTLWLVLRHHRGPVGLLAGAVGGLGAALVAWQLGRRIGLSTYEHLLATAPEGRAFSKPADLRGGGVELLLGVFPVPYGNLLLPAFGAAVTYTLLAGWSRWPSLRPEPEPDAAWPPVGGPGAGPEQGPAGDAAPGSAGTADGLAVSSGPADPPTPTAAPEPPAPGAAEPPRG